MSVPDTLHCFHNVKAWMASVFAKKQKVAPRARVLMEGHLIVFRFSAGPAWEVKSDDAADELPLDPGCAAAGAAAGAAGDSEQVVRYVHPGHVNFSTWHFTVMCMTDDLLRVGIPHASGDAGVLQVACLPRGEAGETHGVVTDLQFFQSLDLNRAWTVSVFGIILDEDCWQQWDTSAKVVPIKQLEDTDSSQCLIWRGSAYELHMREMRKKRADKKRPYAADKAKAPNKRQKKTPSSKASAKAGLHSADHESAEIGAEATGGANPAPDELLQAEADPYGLDPLHEEDAGPELGIGIAEEKDAADADQALADLELMLAGEQDEILSNCSPSVAGSSDGDFDWDELLSGMDAPSGSGNGAASSSSKPAHAQPDDALLFDQRDPPPEPSAIASDAPAELRAPAEQAGARLHRGGPRDEFTKRELELPGWGRLRYYPHEKQLIAVCERHRKADCRMQRTVVENPRAQSSRPGTVTAGQGRPLGLLMNWLRCQHDFDSQQTHIHEYKHDLPGRQEARAWFLSAFAEAPEWADLERPKREGEDDEPSKIR